MSEPIAIAAAIGSQVQAGTSIAAALPPPQAQGPSADFAGLLSRGAQYVEGKVAHANDMVRAFSIDDEIPLHEVTIALEEARLAVELAMQVRARLVETYRDLMNMQL